MRWSGLFDDLEAQAEALATAGRAAEVEERVRVELASQHLRDRLRAALDAPLRLRCSGGLAVAGTLTRVGPDWLLVDEGAGQECVVPLGAVLAVTGLTRLSADPAAEGAVGRRLGLAHALRGIARDRAGVRVWLADGAVLAGTLDRVGADFVELALHPVAEARRRGDVRAVQVVPFAALAGVRRAG